MAIDSDIEVAISQPILDEVLRVLRDKFERSAERLSEVEDYPRSFTRMVVPTQTPKVIAEDPDDDRILECAAASGSAAIISGDGDLLRRGEYAGIKIMRAADFLRLRPEW